MALIAYEYATEGYWDSNISTTGVNILYSTYEIFVSREALSLVQINPIEIRELNITDFHETLRDLEDDIEGMPFPANHSYVGPITISGVTLAQSMQILAPYTVTFENGEYAVNVTGGNSNVGDTVNINNVSVRVANSAGLVDNTGVVDLSPAERQAIAEYVWRTVLPLP